MKKFSILMVVVLAMFTSCTKNTDAIGTWDVVELVVNDQVQNVVPAFINFENPKAVAGKTIVKANGNSGVNNFFGNVYFEKSKFSADDRFGSTKMMGSPLEQGFEDLFTNVLMSADSYEVKEDVLVIRSESMNSTIKFQKRK